MADAGGGRGHDQEAGATRGGAASTGESAGERDAGDCEYCKAGGARGGVVSSAVERGGGAQAVAVPAAGARLHHQHGLLQSCQSLLYIVVVALFIITFTVQPFRIPSESMTEPTLLVGDFLLVNKQVWGGRHGIDGVSRRAKSGAAI